MFHLKMQVNSEVMELIKAYYNLQSDNYDTALTFYCTKTLTMVDQLSPTSPIPEPYQFKYAVLIIQ